MLRNIYLASSWRNEQQPEVHTALTADRHRVYDFRNPAPNQNGFSRSEIDPAWKDWSPWAFTQALETDPAVRGFGYDWRAMQQADTCVLLLPSGRSAHIEAGYFVGHPEKELHILVPELPEPELMYKMADGIHLSLTSLREALR
jgi:hypothetical protein